MGAFADDAVDMALDELGREDGEYIDKYDPGSDYDADYPGFTRVEVEEIREHERDHHEAWPVDGCGVCEERGKGE